MGIVGLREATDNKQVGGKAARLGALLRQGIRVPDGFVITTNAIKTWNSHTANIVRQKFDRLGARYVAVRSSASVEDGSDASWAGQFDTYLFVNGSQLLNKVKRCMSSVNSVRSLSYGRLTGKGARPNIAVIVQAMIPSDVSGVCFSVHPVTQDVDHMVIEAAYGLGEAVVSGEITPDNYVVSRRPPKVAQRSVAVQTRALAFSAEHGRTIWVDIDTPLAPKLSDPQILELAATTEHLEAHFGHPVDIEWAFYQNNLYVLQSRPITTLR